MRVSCGVAWRGVGACSQLQQLKNKYNLLKKKASTAASKARARRSSRSSGSSKLDDVVEEEKTAPTPRRRPSAVPAATSARVAELEDEAESLRVQAAACKQTVDELTEEGDKLRAENKRLRLCVLWGRSFDAADDGVVLF